MRQLYALILGTGLCLPSMALAATPSDTGQRPAAAQQQLKQVTSNPRQAKQDDRARYAAKEAQSGDAKDYRGGDTVVLGATAVTAILAVLLLVVLI